MQEKLLNKPIVVGVVVAALGTVIGGSFLNFFFRQTDPGDAAQDVVSGIRESTADLKGELCSMKRSLERCEESIWVIQRQLTKEVPERRPSDIQDEREVNTYWALRNYKAGDFEKAYSSALQADLENRDVQFILGSMSFFGLGVAKSDKEAFRMWQNAAQQGQPDAQYDLGIMYAQGESVERDASRAMYWLKVASSNGNARASFVIGNVFECGRLGHRDYALAVDWYTRSFEQGFAHAGYHLAQLYGCLKSPVRNVAKSAEWYEKASEAGDMSAMLQWGCLQLGSDPQRGIAILERAFNAGSIDAGSTLYSLYRCGIGVAADQRKAERWLKLIAERSPETARSLKEALEEDADCDFDGEDEQK